MHIHAAVFDLQQIIENDFHVILDPAVIFCY